MKNIKTLMIALFIFNTAFIFAQEKEHAIKTANKINYDEFFKHVSYFASDELEGRDIASEGYHKAALYTAEEFKKTGLKPFGDNNTYFQKVPMKTVSMDQSSVEVNFQNKKKLLNATNLKDLCLMLMSDKETVSNELELVFVGYGNIDPEKGINDYKDVDVKGKVVVVASGSAEQSKDEPTDDAEIKVMNAFRNGASGFIYFTPGFEDKQDLMFNNFAGFLTRSRMSIEGKPFRPIIPMKFAGYAKLELVKELLKLNKIKYKKVLKAMNKGKFVSKALNSKMNYTYNTLHENNSCKNIAALLEGTDSKLKDEYIVVSAHLDHVGIGRPVDGDSIYNGMWDNATGSAATISIAKAFKDGNIKPKRSIIFINYTAEEIGLIGSDYFAHSDLLKDKKVVANVNIDMLGSLYETTDIIPEGYTFSNLSEAADFAANAYNLSITDPTDWEKKYLNRSDQISLLRIGAATMNVGGGTQSIDPDFNVEETINTWMKTVYHKPTDDLNQEFSAEAFHTYLKVNFLITYYAANELNEIIWDKESWVYKRFLKE